jgi:hypothetical protein
VSDVWIGIVGTLSGVTVAGAFAALGALVRRHWQIKDQEAAGEQARMDALHERRIEKAGEILRLIVELETLVLDRHAGRSQVWPTDPAEVRRVRQLLTETEAAAGYLPTPIRRHVQVMISLVDDADDFGQMGSSGASGWSIAWSAVRGAKRNLGRYVREERVPDDLSEPLDSYHASWQEWQDWLEESHEMWLESQREEAAQERARHAAPTQKPDETSGEDTATHD